MGYNQDGRTPGTTQPSTPAQTELIKATYEKSGLDMRFSKVRIQAHLWNEDVNLFTLGYRRTIS